MAADFDALGPLALPKLIAPKDLTINSEIARRQGALAA